MGAFRDSQNYFVLASPGGAQVGNMFPSFREGTREGKETGCKEEWAAVRKAFCFFLPAVPFPTSSAHCPCIVSQLLLYTSASCGCCKDKMRTTHAPSLALWSKDGMQMMADLHPAFLVFHYSALHSSEQKCCINFDTHALLHVPILSKDATGFVSFTFF